MTHGEGRPLRLLVVDDHEVVRQGLVALLDRREGFEVVTQAGTGRFGRPGPLVGAGTPPSDSG